MLQCPKCRSGDIHHSRTKTRFENWRKTVTDKRPFRCRACGWRGWGQDSPPRYEMAAMSHEMLMPAERRYKRHRGVDFDALDGSLNPEHEPEE